MQVVNYTLWSHYVRKSSETCVCEGILYLCRYIVIVWVYCIVYVYCICVGILRCICMGI
jgi:hypothetical protein